MTFPDHRPLDHATLSWDEHGQPQSTRFDDVYFSRTDGLAETRHVFIEGNRLIERWEELPAVPGTFTIAETGFGTGLSFLLTVQLWLEHAPPQWQLHFISTEKYPLHPEDWRRALALWPQLGAPATELAEHLPLPLSGTHRRTLARGRVRLTLLYGDAVAGLESCLEARQGSTSTATGGVDAWFLDGFAPARNSDLWTPRLYSVMAHLSGAHATIATFTAAGHVRRGLIDAGFIMSRVPGYGSKREMLIGQRAGHTTQAPAWHETPWFAAPPHTRPHARQATVIGAGIAGCATAAALARRGWQVTLIDRHALPGSEASGNPQGILYPRLSRSDGALARFALQALLYAYAWYEPYWGSGAPGQRCGVLMLPSGASQAKDSLHDEWRALANHFKGSGLVELLDNSQLRAIAQLPLGAAQALYLPHGGWVAPARVCAAVTDHPNIRFIQAEISRIERDADDCWQTWSSAEQITSTPTLVLANAAATNRFAQVGHLPLRVIRGQVSMLPDGSELAGLRTVLCGDGYIAPEHNGCQTLGATYDLDDTTSAARFEDHRRNLETLARTDSALGPLLENSAPLDWGARVAFRCTTPDYLPVVGPAPDRDAVLEVYGGLRQDARRVIAEPCPLLPGLYLHCALGSRGLTYAPLGAEYLADLMEGQLPALPLTLQKAVHPARFLIRDLRKKRL